jgi:hypothetical protein
MVATDMHVVRAAIFPPIGVARVGNSRDGWFVGPEVTHPAPQPLGFYRDAAGALKREVARFRIYGLNRLGEIVRELSATDPGTEITWTVQLANTKAAWYQFQLALDIPEAASAPATNLRNAKVADRATLAITPSPKSVSGVGATPCRFDDSAFMGKQVYLGEIRTDGAGRLLVFGGHGKSASFDGSRATTFANNDGWHDDVSDGPVTAQVQLDGAELEVLPAWVVVAPPNYAPQRKSVRTMWDLMRDTAIKVGMLPVPERPSFTDEILPLFERLAGLQWVNAGFAGGFGWDGAFDLVSREALTRLASDRPAHAALRKSVANQFRDFQTDSYSPVPWPWMYGDAMDVPAANTPRQNAALTDTQLWCLQEWAAGRFIADFDPHATPPRSIDDVPVAAQGDMLIRASMEFCLADAFHPGCEMTWPMRTPSLYMAPFRLAHAAAGHVGPELGNPLTPAVVTEVGGPLFGQVPGGLTRWMAVPWQTDTASCRSGYDKSYDPYVPSFWPARVPNEVLTAESYEAVMNERLSPEARREAFAKRVNWLDPLGTGDYVDVINAMVAHFDVLGVVEVRPGPPDGCFPATIEVEDRHAPVTGAAEAPALGSAPRQPVAWHQIEKVQRFPHGLRR